MIQAAHTNRLSLEAQFKPLEAIRLEYYAKMKRMERWLYVALLVVGLAFLGWFQGLWWGYALGVGGAGVLGFLGVLIWGTTPLKKQFNATFKQAPYQQLLKTLYPALDYTPLTPVDQALFRQSELFEKFDRYEGGDFFEGALPNGVSFQCSQLKVEDTTQDADGTNQNQIVFQGLFFVLTPPSPAPQHIRILPDLAERALGKFGKIMQQATSQFLQKGADLVYFEEHPEFEKRFAVYSKDENSARQWLTPPVLDALHSLQQHQEPLRFSWINGVLFAALPLKKPLLLPKLEQSVMDEAFWTKLTKDLAVMMEFLSTIGRLHELAGSSTASPTEGDRMPIQQPKAPKPGVSYKKSNSKDNPFLL